MAKSGLIKVARAMCSEITFTKAGDVVRIYCLDPSNTALIWSDVKIEFSGAESVSVSTSRLDEFEKVEVSADEVKIKLSDGRIRKLRPVVGAKEIKVEDILSSNRPAVTIRLTPVDAGAIKEIMNTYDTINVKVTADGASIIASDGGSFDELVIGKDMVTLMVENPVEFSYSTLLLKKLLDKSCSEIVLFDSGVMEADCDDYSFVHAPAV